MTQKNSISTLDHNDWSISPSVHHFFHASWRLANGHVSPSDAGGDRRIFWRTRVRVRLDVWKERVSPPSPSDDDDRRPPLLDLLHPLDRQTKSDYLDQPIANKKIKKMKINYFFLKRQRSSRRTKNN